MQILSVTIFTFINYRSGKSVTRKGSSTIGDISNPIVEAMVEKGCGCVEETIISSGTPYLKTLSN